MSNYAEFHKLTDECDEALMVLIEKYIELKNCTDQPAFINVEDGYFFKETIISTLHRFEIAIKEGEENEGV